MPKPRKLVINRKRLPSMKTKRIRIPTRTPRMVDAGNSPPRYVPSPIFDFSPYFDRDSMSPEPPRVPLPGSNRPRRFDPSLLQNETFSSEPLPTEHRIVDMALGDHEFTVAMRRVEVLPGAPIWAVRLVRDNEDRTQFCNCPEAREHPQADA